MAVEAVLDSGMTYIWNSPGQTSYPTAPPLSPHPVTLLGLQARPINMQSNQGAASNSCQFLV